MIAYLLWGLLIYLIHILTPPVFYFVRPGEPLANKLEVAAGPRDQGVQYTIGGERARRAQRNYEESLPFFITLGLLLLYTGTAEGLGNQGATVFLIARLAYLPVYVAGIPMLRTLLWLAAWVGLVMMGIGLHR